MATLRPFYAGDKVSAKQLNELVCAIECLCSQMKNLQRTQRTSSFQNATTQRRYSARAESYGLSYGVHELADDEPQYVMCERYVLLCRSSATVEHLPFTFICGIYLSGGAIFDGKNLIRICSTWGVSEYYPNVWYGSDYGIDNTFSVTAHGVGLAMRGGTALMVGGYAVHRGSGVVERNCFYGYGVVQQPSTSLQGGVYVSQFPFHIYKQGIDVYTGGCTLACTSVAGSLQYLNAIHVANFCGRSIGLPSTEAFYFATAYGDGTMVTGDWYARGKLGCSYYCGEERIYCSSSVGRPLFLCQLLRYSFCLCADYSDPDSVKIKGRYQELDRSWRMTVPVAYSVVNCADGLTCVRMLEQEILVAPSTMFTQFCTRYGINTAGITCERDLCTLRYTDCRDAIYVSIGGSTRPHDTTTSCLPVAIPENCFGFPACSLWDWDF